MSLIIRQMQIKVTVRYYLHILIRMANQSLLIASVDMDVEHFINSCLKCKMLQLLWKTVQHFF